MIKIYKQNCKFCKKEYEGTGKFFCSYKCKRNEQYMSQRDYFIEKEIIRLYLKEKKTTQQIAKIINYGYQKTHKVLKINNVPMRKRKDYSQIFLGDIFENFCRCGCGAKIKIKEYCKYKGVPNYIKGHYFKGQKRRDVSKRMMGENNPAKTIKFSKNHHMKKPEIVKKVLESRKNNGQNWLSVEARKKISEAHTGKVGYWSGKKRPEMLGKNNPRFGKQGTMLNKKHTIEAREKIRKANSNPSEETRKKKREARAKRVIPKKDTTIEVKIQEFLSKLHIEFVTHKYISEITHSYQCDIFIPEQKGINQKTIIEADGCHWHFCEKCNKNKILIRSQREQIERDLKRTSELIEAGFKVIRLWEHEIKVMKLEDFEDKLNRQSKKL